MPTVHLAARRRCLLCEMTSITDVTVELEASVRQAFDIVHHALLGATSALLEGDRDAARAITAADRELDELHLRIETMALNGLTTQGPLSEREVRALVTVLRIAPELERSGDLATHVADLGAQRLATWLTPRACDLISQMSVIGVEMWSQAKHAYIARDLAAGDRLRTMDDEIDDLHVSLIAELAAVPLSVPVAVQVGLVARYLERLGDHAVNVAQQLRHLAPPDSSRAS